MLLVALMAPWAAMAQNRQIVEIGTGSSTDYYPMPGYWGFQYDVYLYTPSAAPELGVDSDISSIAYNLSSTSSYTGATIEIWVKDVDASFALNANTTFADYISGATKVVDDNAFTTDATGWKTMNFPSPFSHQGGKALLVAVRGVGCSTTGGCSRKCYYTSASNMHWAKHKDSSDPDTSATGSLDGERSNIRLDVTYTGSVCFAPTNLTCTAYTATTATLGWTENGEATSWVLQYSMDNTFATGVQSVNVSTTSSTQLTSLTAETTYYARVKPDCDTDGTKWSNVCEFKPTAAQNLTVNDESTTNSYIPIYGNYVDWGNRSQFIIPAASITDMTGATINKITLYATQSSTTFTNDEFSVYMKEVSSATFASTAFEDWSSLTEVYSGSVSISNNKMEITFSTPYTYDGGNLLIGFHQTAYNATVSCTWKGTAQTGSTALYQTANSSHSWTGTVTSQSFLPKTTFTYLPTSTPKPRNLQVTEKTSESATLTWEAPANATPMSYFYHYKKATDAYFNQPIDNGHDLSVTINELAANTEYNFGVYANYSEGMSDYAEITFTTEATCLPPTSVTCTGVTSTTATFTWNADGTECQFNLVAPGTPEANYGDGSYSQSGTVTQVTFGDGTPLGGAALTPNTEYLFVVRKWCGDTDYSTWETLTVRTDCGAVTSFPWSENFESYASGTFSDPCWVNEHISGNGTSLFSIYTSSNGSNSTHQLQLPDQSQGTLTKLVLPEMTLPNNNYEFIIDIYRSNSTYNAQSPNEGVRVYASTNGEIEGATELAFLSRQYNAEHGSIPAEAAEGWYTYKLPIGISGTCYIILRGESQYCSSTNMDNFKVKEMVTVTANQIVANNPGENQMTWSQFAQHVNNGDHFTSTTFTLMDDITITEMVGTAENPFSGTFDGNYHTITVDLTATDNNFTAPFRIIRNATIQNLKVDGTINDGGYKFCAGFAGDCYGNNIFTNCESAVTINATTEGDGTHGGFIARNYGSSSSASSSLATTTFNGCAFTGQLLGANTTQSAGFCGWSEYQSPNFAKTIFNNCLFAPQAVTMSTTNSAAFARRRSASYVNFNNCYFMQDFNDGTNNTAQGKQAYTIAGVDPVYVAFSGEHTLYNMSGIDAYTEGMIHGYTKLAGEGDQVVLTLSGSTTGDYQADNGTLTPSDDNFILAMTANDTEISESCNAPTNLRVPAQSINAHGASIAWDNPDGKQFEYYLTVGPDYTQTSWQETTDPGMQYAIYLENPLAQNTDYRFYLRKKCGENYYSVEVYVDFHTIAGNQAPTSLAYDDVDAHTATITWSGVSTNYYHQSYDLYYSTDETMPQTPVQDNLIGGITTTSQGLTSLNGQTTYYVWVRDNCGDDGYSTWAGPISFTTAISCPAPTQFAASDVTNHTATLSWQGTSDSYTVQYRTAAGVNASMLNENFNSLTTANSIPANWDNSEGTTTTESYKWCYNTSTSGNGATNGTSHDGSKCVRYNSFNASANQTNFLKTPSMDFPAGETMVLSFWYKNPAGGDFSVYISTDGGTTKTALKEGMTAQSSWKQETITLSDYVGASNVTIHFKATSNYGNGDAYIYLDDVKIGTEVAAGEWQNATVDGTTANLSGLIADRDYEATVQGDCGEVDGQSTIVSTTFTTDLPCPDPTNLQVVENSLKSDRVTLSWDSDYAEAWTVAYKAEDDADFTETTAPVNPYTLEGLTEETTYTVKVRSNCGSADGLSTGWSNEVTFTTTEACVVMDVAVSDVTHHAATVTWTGDNKDEDKPGFTVSYRTAQQIDGVEESFDGSSIPSGWALYLGKVDDVVAGTATLNSSTSYAWKIATASTNVFNSNHAKLNIYGTSVNSWLVSPEMSLPSNGAVSFDLALTAYDYNGGSTSAASGTCADDRFAFLVYANDAWHILREWNNAEGTTYVYNSIATTGEHVNIDLSAYNGQTVKIAFYGESTASGGDNDLHIDNVTIGTPVAAGTWQTVSAANDASSANLSGLTAGTKYDVKVAPNCDATLESDVLQFTTVSPNEKWFITEGNWGKASNWEPVGAPTIEQNVVLKANATIESGCVAEAKSINGTGTSADNFTLTIKDSGKLKHLNSGVRATVEKEIRAYNTNYDEENYNNGDYYLITNPLTSNVTPDAENNYLLSGSYDFYSWDYSASDDNEWRNYEANPKPFTSLNVGAYGYLYANETGATLTYTGTINAYTNSKSRYCGASSSPENYDFPGWYLLGNPYMYDAYLATATTSGTALPYIKMNDAGDGFTNVAAGTPIEPMEGFFYQQATTSGSVYVVTYEPAATKNSKLNMNLRRDNKQLDNAILVFGGEQQLGKMTFRPNSSKIFMPVEGKDYAITSVEGQVGEVPVSFVPENNGTYSLSFTSEEVSFSYLHLIDNMTGADVNLLQTPSYTFDARTSDYESRFRLVFATGSSVDGDTFGFVNASGNFCIFGIEGEATVQVIDILGHVISSETFSGSYEKRINGAPGVYMVRLINGNDVKIQKVVVR